MWGDLFDRAKKDLTELVGTIAQDTETIFRDLTASEELPETFSEYLGECPECIREFDKDDHAYITFSNDLNVKEKSEEIAALLKQDPVVDGTFRKYVPQELGYVEFWTRFFFLRSQYNLQQRSLENKNRVIQKEDDWGNDEEEGHGTYPPEQSEADTEDSAKQGVDAPKKNNTLLSRLAKDVSRNVGNIIKDLDKALFKEEDGDNQSRSINELEVREILGELNSQIVSLRQENEHLHELNDIFRKKLIELGIENPDDLLPKGGTNILIMPEGTREISMHYENMLPIDELSKSEPDSIPSPANISNNLIQEVPDEIKDSKFKKEQKSEEHEEKGAPLTKELQADDWSNWE